MNGRRLKHVTREQINELWPPIDNSFKKVENPNFSGRTPIIDKLLSSYEIGDHKKTVIFSKIVERMSLPRVSCPATLVIHTAQMSTKEGVGGKLMDE